MYGNSMVQLPFVPGHNGVGSVMKVSHEGAFLKHSDGRDKCNISKHSGGPGCDGAKRRCMGYAPSVPILELEWLALHAAQIAKGANQAGDASACLPGHLADAGGMQGCRPYPAPHGHWHGP